jgi:hypothetical protein
MKCEFYIIFELTGKNLDQVIPVKIRRKLPALDSGQFAVKMDTSFPDNLVYVLYPSLTATITEDDIAAKGIECEVIKNDS